MFHSFCKKDQLGANFIQHNSTKIIDLSCNQRNIWEFVSSVDKINQFEKETQLQNLILLLKYILQIRSNSLSLKSQAGQLYRQSSQCNRAQIQSISKQYQDIKIRHERLLVRILNLRAKMANQMYMHRASSSDYQIDLNILCQSIRHRKTQITNKCNRLSFIKLNNCPRLFQNQCKQCHQFDGILKQFKKGTEILQKETLKTKLQLDMLIQYSRGPTIVNQ